MLINKFTRKDTEQSTTQKDFGDENEEDFKKMAKANATHEERMAEILLLPFLPLIDRVSRLFEYLKTHVKMHCGFQL
jgi:hypothetical protein